MSEFPSWFRERSYLHFDQPIGISKATKIVTNPELVAKHSFYPFIGSEIASLKIAKDPITHQIIYSEKKREIAYSAHLDTHIYAYYAEQLAEPYEKQLASLGIENSVLAFRRLNKSNIDFAYEAFNAIKEYGRDCAVIGMDISKFFDTLNHQYLKQMWCKVLGVSVLPPDQYKVFKSLTKHSHVKKEDLYRALSIPKNNPRSVGPRLCDVDTFRRLIRHGKLINTNPNQYGIPQGSPISALLSNIYMLEFDNHTCKTLEEFGGKYFRYCDDMLLIVPHDKLKDTENFIDRYLSKLSLQLNKKKTNKHIFYRKNGALIANKPLQYLGFMFDGERIFIRSSSLARYTDRMKRSVWKAKRNHRKTNTVRQMKGLSEIEMPRKKLYKKHSYLGRRNFISYGLRAANTMKSRSIKKQIKPYWRLLQTHLEK